MLGETVFRVYVAGALNFLTLLSINLSNLVLNDNCLIATVNMKILSNKLDTISLWMVRWCGVRCLKLCRGLPVSCRTLLRNKTEHTIRRKKNKLGKRRLRKERREKGRTSKQLGTYAIQRCTPTVSSRPLTYLFSSAIVSANHCLRLV